MNRILVVANDFPYPPAHGAAVDMWTRILILEEMHYEVDLLVTVRETPDEERMNTARQHVKNLWLVRRQTGLASFLSFLPYQVRSRFPLRTVSLGQRFDGVILEAEYVAPFIENPAAQQAKLILRVHNEQVGYFRDLAEGADSWKKKLYYYSESFKFRFLSPSVMKRCDLLWFISDSERQDHVNKKPEDDKKSFFLPTHVNPSSLKPYSVSGKTVLFLGTLTISHNSNSVAWYIENIHPRLSDLDGYCFQVAGRTAGQPIPALRNLIQQNKNVFLEEDPVTLDGIYGSAAVFANPVIRGAGIKVKVVQALQAGLPVVSTSMGIEGTGFRDSVHVLVADTPEQFAGCVRKLLNNPALAESLVRNAQAFLAERYDMKANMQKTLSEILSVTH